MYNVSRAVWVTTSVAWRWVLQLDVLMLSVKARARLTWVEGMVRGDACMWIAYFELFQEG